jgi:hypothetical protein
MSTEKRALTDAGTGSRQTADSRGGVRLNFRITSPHLGQAYLLLVSTRVAAVDVGQDIACLAAFTSETGTRTTLTVDIWRE